MHGRSNLVAMLLRRLASARSSHALGRVALRHACAPQLGMALRGICSAAEQQQQGRIIVTDRCAEVRGARPRPVPRAPSLNRSPALTRARSAPPLPQRIIQLNSSKGLVAREAQRLLRLSVEPGGCSGFQYSFALEEASELEEDDEVFEHAGARVVVDSSSLELIKGSTVRRRARRPRAPRAPRTECSHPSSLNASHHLSLNASPRLRWTLRMR